MVESRRQLSPYTSAALSATWQPGLGQGLGFSSTRDLGGGWEADYSWTVGPPEASGMGLSIAKRGAGYLVSAKLEVPCPPPTCPPQLCASSGSIWELCSLSICEVKVVVSCLPVGGAVGHLCCCCIFGMRELALSRLARMGPAHRFDASGL